MKQWKWLLKIAVTAALLCWVGSGIDRGRFAAAVGGADRTLLLLAIIPYIFSRITAAFRLTLMLNVNGIPLSRITGLYLHWISMFYGMFLPGGLGGDAYKLVRLRQYFPEQKTILLTTTLLWDRIIGLTVLVLLAGLLVATRLYDFFFIGGVAAIGIVSAVIFRIAAARFLHDIIPVLGRLLILSTLTQVAQIVCIVVLLKAVGASGHLVDYILIFLLSSIAAMFPLSIGGVGIRELVFMKGAQFLGTSEHIAVTASVLFDIIVTLTAITGAFLVLGKGVGEPVDEPAFK